MPFPLATCSNNYIYHSLLFIIPTCQEACTDICSVHMTLKVWKKAQVGWIRLTSYLLVI